MRLLTVTALLFLTAAAPRLVQADQLDTLLANKKMICGVQASTPPFGFPDPQTSQQVGHDVNLCHAIADKLGGRWRLNRSPRKPKCLKSNSTMWILAS